MVFLLIEDETGTVNLIVPPRVYERDRLTVRTEPLVLVEGTLERHAAAGGAINVLVRSIVPLDAPDRAAERPDATVTDFSPLDERERQRILAEQPLVAVAGGGAVPRRARAGRRAGRRRVGERRCPTRGRPRVGDAARRPAPAARARTPARARARARARRETPDASGAGRDAPANRGERRVREHAGAEDFRAVAPPVMSFAQGRRR